MKRPLYPLTRHENDRKGASLVEYGILTGLIAVMAIGAVYATGTEIDETFRTVAERTSVASILGADDDATGGAEEDAVVLPPEPDPDACFDPANVGTVGLEHWTGCEGMLIVDRALLNTRSWTSGPEPMDYRVTVAGQDYTFGNSEFNIFTGQVTDMSSLFSFPVPYTADISYWDTSNVITFMGFFSGQTFDTDISGWDVSSATQMHGMFGANTVNAGDLSSWCVSNITMRPNQFTLFPGVIPFANEPVWGTCPGG